MDTTEDRPIRGQVRLTGHRRVSHGLYLEIRENLAPFEEFLRDLRAILLVLPVDAVFTHVTAARLLGWQLPALPEQVPYFAAVRCDQRPRRPGLICSRLTGATTPGNARGLPIDTAEEILLRCARDLSVLDLVIMIDSALRLGHLDPARMRALLATSRPGVVRLRKAWALADAKAESGGETVLRVFHVAMGVDVESQFEVYDAHGNFLGRADLLIRGTDQLREYDGAGHREGKQHTTDLRRERGLVGTPFERSGFTLDDLLNHPAVLMQELDRLLDRPHKLARLARWRALLDESLYSETGRQRVLNRWRRAMGVSEWSRTA
jgi:hypothetical protein